MPAGKAGFEGEFPSVSRQFLDKHPHAKELLRLTGRAQCPLLLASSYSNPSTSSPVLLILIFTIFKRVISTPSAGLTPTTLRPRVALSAN